MRIRKCDICKKVIQEDQKEVIAGLGLLTSKEFCLNCGKPIINFLLNKKFIKKEDFSKFKTKAL